MNIKVGVVGLGNMGTAVSSRLAANGVKVSGWTRSGVDADWAKQQGVIGHDTLGSLVAECDVILLSLFDDQAVSSVLDQLLRLDLEGRLIVDTSTVNPNVLTGCAERFAQARASVLDAPISGWPTMVAQGKAGIFIGGDKNDVARFLPLAELLSNRVFHIGALGQGLAAKIVNNMMLSGYWECLREALAVGQSRGLSGETMLEVLLGGPAANGVLAGKAKIILGADAPPSFTVAGLAKDLAMFKDVATQGGIDTPAISAALDSFNQHKAAGHGDADFATMPGAVLKRSKDVL